MSSNSDRKNQHSPGLTGGSGDHNHRNWAPQTGFNYYKYQASAANIQGLAGHNLSPDLHIMPIPLSANPVQHIYTLRLCSQVWLRTAHKQWLIDLKYGPEQHICNTMIRRW